VAQLMKLPQLPQRDRVPEVTVEDGSGRSRTLTRSGSRSRKLMFELLFAFVARLDCAAQSSGEQMLIDGFENQACVTKKLARR